jgi:hypothetical protein
MISQVITRTSLFTLVLVFAALLLMPSQGNARSEDCSSGACFPMQVTEDGQQLVLRSTHLFRWWGFRVYSVALYTAPEFRNGQDILGDVPKRLVLHYHRSIDRGKMIQGAEVVIGRTPDIDMDALRERVDRVNRVYVDVRSGDEYSITYLPGKGTTVALNGNSKVLVEGNDFAHAYFGIWLGSMALNDGLKQALLNFRLNN